MSNLVNVQIETKDGINVVSSRVIAHELGKRHADVVNQIENIFNDENVRRSIIKSKYEHRGNIYKEYLLTKDGFILYMFNIQGYNDFKMAYINRFNEMEKALKEMSVPKLPSYAEALRQLADSIETNERLMIENKEMKPKAEFFDAVTDSKTAIQMGDVAKVLDMGMGRNKLFEILRNQRVLMQDNRPYQKYIDNGWFRTVETKFTKQNGDTSIHIKTMVYQKGVDGIRKLLNKTIKGE